MTPGIGLMKRRLETERQAVAVAISYILKEECKINSNNKAHRQQKPEDIKILETKYDGDSGDWYVALSWSQKRGIVRMDSVQGTVIDFKEI